MMPKSVWRCLKMREIVFHLGFATIAAHEMDAVANAEWRLLPLLNLLPEDLAYVTFVLLHVPLFAGLIWLCWSTGVAMRRRWRALLSAFLVLHVGLHLFFAGHPDYAFDSMTSELLIFGGGIFGLLYLLWPLFGTVGEESVERAHEDG